MIRGKRIEKAINLIKKSKEPLIVTHHDADGIASGGLMYRLFNALGKEPEVVVLRQLYADTLEQIDFSGHDLVVFTDLGLSYAEKIYEYADSYIIIDHHRGEYTKENVIVPELFGYSGDVDASASTLAAYMYYIITKDPKGASYGLIGAYGDRQLEERPSGLNRELLTLSLQQNVLYILRDFYLEGIYFKHLPWVLYYSYDPYLSGISGNWDSIYYIFEKSGLLKHYPDGRITYRDLTIDERRRFFTWLLITLTENGWTLEDVKSLISDIYKFIGNHGWVGYVNTFSSLLNAVGKHREPMLGIQLINDEFYVLPEAEKTLQDYRKLLFRSINEALRYAVIQGNVVSAVLDNVPVYTSGTLAQVLEKEFGRPSIVAVKDGRYYKISVRGGSNVGDRLRQLAYKHGGEGGGHYSAGGARISADSLVEFMEELINDLNTNSCENILNKPSNIALHR